jgi:hypothetical protein
MVAYLESPLDRIVDVHFGSPGPPPPPTPGIINFTAAGIDFVLPAQNGVIQLSQSWFNETGDYGTVIFHNAGVNHAGLRGSHASVSGAFHAEIWGGTQDGSPLGPTDDLQMDTFIYIVDDSGSPLVYGGPLHVEWTDNFKDAQFSGGFAIPPEGIAIKVAFSAIRTAGLVVQGLARTYPGTITINVAV